jgi:hypothetical protein
MAASGVRIVRAVFSWPQIEHNRGSFDFSFYDRYVGQLARYHLRILPIMNGSPPAYSAAPKARNPDRAQPKRNGPFARFARAVARRYGTRGSFWREHPALPRMPIRSWQIWNEPNLSFFWAPRPSPSQYARLLRAAAQTIKRVDRDAEIVLGGLPESQFGVPVERYLRGLYQAGGGRWFDTMALHIYARDSGGALRVVERVRRVMDRLGDRRAGIWVTEFGWPSGGPRHRFRVGERGQAVRIRRTLQGLWRKRRRLRVRGAVYVAWRDLQPYRSDYWGLHVGLYRADGKPKRAARVFSMTARGLDSALARGREASPRRAAARRAETALTPATVPVRGH